MSAGTETNKKYGMENGAGTENRKTAPEQKKCRFVKHLLHRA